MLIELYKLMGCNIFRVWGGAYLEREDFYDLCDRAGILVWQEFPLSSSGVDNYAPDDPAVIKKLCDIATDYIHRRAHHACKLLSTTDVPLAVIAIDSGFSDQSHFSTMLRRQVGMTPARFRQLAQLR